MMHTHLTIRLMLPCLLLAGGTLLAAADAPTAPATGTVILDENALWRFHVTLRPPVVAAGGDGATSAAAPVVLPVKVPYRHYPGLERLETEPPAEGWTKPEFDDVAWPRARAAVKSPASIADVVLAPGVGFSSGLVCLRGKFAVSDPAAVTGLSLVLKYRGGVVVYLNGQEVARQHLPRGAVKPQTPGEPYPAEAFVDAQGKALPGGEQEGKRAGGENDVPQRLARRNRELGPVALPAGALRKGVNVLAIELHRSDYHPSAASWFQERNLGRDAGWVPVGLVELRLTAAGGAAAANVARPQGLQVWNHDINDRVSVLDYGDPNEPLRLIVLMGARNGAFSGQVLVGDTQPIVGLRATVSDLKTADGRGVIPARDVRVRYGVLDGHHYQQPDWFDGLDDAPPAQVPVQKTGGAVQPVWVTVRVPPDAAASEYRGTLTITAQGAPPASVPIHLHVADWRLPEPRDFRTYVGVYQSPTTLAMQYKVAEWSEEHWKLMEKSFALLGEVGNKIVNIPVVEQTQFGNDEGMVYWVKRPDGSFDHDFRVFDRYLALVKKHLGKPDFVALHVWHSGGWETRAADQKNTVTVVDPRTGLREHLQVPTFATPESKRFWQPVLDALRARLAAQGMEQAMCLGILSDGTAPPEVFAAFNEMLPGGARWTRGCHTATREAAPYTLRGGGVVACHEFCYGMAMADPQQALPPIWRQRSWPGVAFIRHNFDDSMSLLKYRTMAERSLYCGTRGVGRVGLDYWNVLAGEGPRRANLYNRWPNSSCHQREPNLFRLAWPAPDGPAATVRFEQLREGVQEAEAMIVVAEALGERGEKLRADLAEECRQLFIDRINHCRRNCPEGYGRIHFRTHHYGWQELAARLFWVAGRLPAQP